MSFLFLVSKINAIFAVAILALIGLGAAPMAFAGTTQMPVTASSAANSGPCLHHQSGDSTSKAHATCQNGSEQNCPDDMDCGKSCTTTCTSAVFLTVSANMVAHPNRLNVYNLGNIPFVPYQSALNAPPPRA
ncbi:MAG: hypothetical protein COA84_08030 [Robiginitomaculum sp.]|nr:MAG: hypothetical protein COA84_08030 [Robiginitomaculum sp.]